MKIWITATMAMAVLLSLSIVAEAGNFDASKPFLCSVIKVMECIPEDGCQEVRPKVSPCPNFLRLILIKKSSSRPGRTMGIARAS